MAATLYNIFIRYMNNNKVITEQTSIDWMSDFDYREYQAYFNSNASKYNSIASDLSTGRRKKEELTAEELAIYEKCKRLKEYEYNISKGKGVHEVVRIEPYDEMYIAPGGTAESHSIILQNMKKQKLARDTANQRIITSESKTTNPKFDMIFAYNGLGEKEADRAVYNGNPTNTNPPPTPYIYYDNMKRVIGNPWFFYAQYGSLQAAMTKAKELVNILGTEGVIIGKCVALDQYIEIV